MILVNLLNGLHPTLIVISSNMKYVVIILLLCAWMSFGAKTYDDKVKNLSVSLALMLLWALCITIYVLMRV